MVLLHLGSSATSADHSLGMPGKTLGFFIEVVDIHVVGAVCLLQWDSFSRILVLDIRPGFVENDLVALADDLKDLCEGFLGLSCRYRIFDSIPSLGLNCTVFSPIFGIKAPFAAM